MVDEPRDPREPREYRPSGSTPPEEPPTEELKAPPEEEPGGTGPGDPPGGDEPPPGGGSGGEGPLPPRDDDDPGVMPFLEHLEELRRTIIAILIAVGIGAAICWWASGPVLDWLIDQTSGQAIFMKPQGAFVARLKVALVLGLLLALPYVFYKAWSFIGPGLLSTERKVVLPGVIFSVTLFYTGIAFSYFALTPLMVQVLMGFGTTTLTPQTEITFLLDLVFTMGLACGLVFQMPLVIAFLTLIGIVTPRFLRTYWRHAMVLIFIAAALLTPADPLSQVLLAIPLILLYGLSFLLSSILHRSRRAKRAAETNDAAGD